MRELRFMHEDGPVESFRCRVYDGIDNDAAAVARAKRHEDEVMAGAVSGGFIEAPAYDATIAELVTRGWLETKPRMVAVGASDPSRGRYAAWDATEKGRAEWKP